MLGGSCDACCVCGYYGVLFVVCGLCRVFGCYGVCFVVCDLGVALRVVSCVCVRLRVVCCGLSSCVSLWALCSVFYGVCMVP